MRTQRYLLPTKQRKITKLTWLLVQPSQKATNMRNLHFHKSYNQDASLMFKQM